MRRSALDFWAEGLAQPTGRIGLLEWDGFRRWLVRRGRGRLHRYEQDDRRGKRVRRGRWVFGERRLKLETGQGQAVEPEPHRSEDQPLHAERIRRSWEATKCGAMGFEEVASGEWRVASGKKKQIPRCARNDNSRRFGRAGVEAEVGVIGPVWVRGRAGSGSCGCR